MPPRMIACTLPALAAALVVTGCASPYVPLTPRPEVQRQAAAVVQPPALGISIDEAHDFQALYRAKVIELGEADRALANGLLTLGTLIVGLAASNSHRSAIEGTGIVAGAVYTGARMNSDERRARIYVAGIKAMQCAVAAVTPLALDAGLASALGDGKAGVARAIEATSQRLGEVEGLALRARVDGASRYQPALQAMTEALVQAQAAITRGDEAVDLAQQRLSKPHGIAADLHNAVQRIDRQVLDEIRGTANAMQAVPGIIAGLQGNAALFSRQALWPTATIAAPGGAGIGGESVRPTGRTGGNGPAPAASAPPEDPLATAISKALGQLRGATVRLRSEAERLAQAAATTSSAQQVSTAVKECEVEGTVKPIRATPATVAFVAGKASTQSILVDGGNGNYAAAFLQTPTPGLSVAIRPRSKGIIELVATDQTVAGGSYQLIVEDTTQQSQQLVAVTVSSATPATPPNRDDAPTTVEELIDKTLKEKLPPKTKLKTAAGAEVEVQQAKRLGTNGVELRYRTLSGAPKSAEVVKAAAVLLASLSEKIEERIVAIDIDGSVNPVGRRGPPAAGPAAPPAPSALTGRNPGAIRQVQLRLCMRPEQATGAWTAASQEALVADRKRRARQPSPIDGPLTAQEVAELLALSPQAAAARCPR